MENTDVRKTPTVSPLQREIFSKRKTLVGILIFLIALQAATGTLLKSPTFDEVRFLGLGLYIVRHHRWDMDVLVHPPLTYYLHSIPLTFLKIPDSVWAEPTSIHRGRAIIHLFPNDLVIRLARSPIILLSLGLALYIYRWAKELYGNGAGLLALFFYAFNPTVLAFSAIINADMAITAFVFMTLYHWWRFCKSASRLHLVLTGIAFGLALLAKYNGLMLLPIFILLIPAWLLWGRARSAASPLRHRWPKMMAALFVVLLLGFFVAWAGYGFEWGFATTPAQRPHRLVDALLPHTDGLRQVSYKALERIPLPMPHFIKGVSMLYLSPKVWTGMFATREISFLMGKYSEKGWWYYYLVAFVIKTPVGLLILLVLAFLFLRKLGSADSLDEAFLLIPPLFFVLYFSASEVQIGLRYILPAFPFLFVYAARTVHLHRALPQRPARLTLVFLCLWYAASTVAAHPNHLAYFNELVGGPDNGYRYLVDSNLDWGQELGALKKYMDAHGIAKIKLSYFGTAEPEYYGIDYDYLPSSLVEQGWSYLSKASASHRPKLPTTGLIAISATELQATYFADKNIYAWLKAYQPVAKLGYSIFIYRIE